MEQPIMTTTINKETLLPLSLVAILCSGVIWINTSLMEINYKLTIIEESLDTKFTKFEAEHWVHELKLRNPTLDIPEVAL